MSAAVRPASAPDLRHAAFWIPAYVGLGSNLEDPPRQLRLALSALARLQQVRLVTYSGFFRNPPMGVVDQPLFVNAVAGILTRLSAHELLDALKGIERAQGRDRETSARWGPRVLDLDLLVYGQSQLADERLTLPHPGIAQRNFVLFPLHEIAPGLAIPGHGRVGELVARLDCSGLERLA